MNSAVRAAVDPSWREQAILTNLGQVRVIASKVWRQISQRSCTLQLDDLISEGVIGLIHAVDNFDSSRGITLNTYADRRIRGAIQDALRKTDSLSRTSRKALKRIGRAIYAVEQRELRSATDEEIAAELGIHLRDYLLLKDRNSVIESVEFRPDLQVLSRPEACPHAALEQAEEQLQIENRLKVGLKSLDPRQRVVMRSLLKGKTSRELGHKLRLSEARVSQIKEKAVKVMMRTETTWPSPKQRHNEVMKEEV